ALGYPGFTHLRPRRWALKNPAEVLLAALAQDDLEPRLVEALPWLLRTMRRSIENGSCAKRRSAICKIAWDSSSACHGGSRSASERETKQQPSRRSKPASSEAAWLARTPCAGPRYQRPSVAGYGTTDPT